MAHVQSRLLTLARHYPGRFGLRDRHLVQRPLGSGDCYDAWLLTPADAPPGPDRSVVVRIARYPLAALPRPMGEEYEALRRIPAGLGPRCIRLQTDAEELGSPFIVTTWVPGGPRPAHAWSDDDLRACARRLAALHAHRHTGAGQLAGPPARRRGQVSILADLDADLRWWRRLRPDVVAQVEDLLPAVRTRLEATEAALEGLRTFSVVHGDLAPANVLFDDADGGVRFIDWKWAEVSDPARDLAALGGTVPHGELALLLTPDRIALLVDAYAAARHATGGLPEGESAEALTARHAGWELKHRLLASLRHRARLAEGPFEASAQCARAVEETTRALRGL